MPVFLSGEFHGQRSPWGHKESDTTEQLITAREDKQGYVIKWEWHLVSKEVL